MKEDEKPKRSGGRKAAAKPAEFFVSYSGHDLPTAEYFRGWLAQAGYSTYMQSRDFPTASNFLERMNEGIKCERLLAIHTANYARSAECMEELWAMRKRDPSGLDGRVVILKLDATAPPPLLGARVHIDLSGKSGDAVQSEFLRGIKALPKPKGNRCRKSVASVSPPPPPPPVFPATGSASSGVHISQQGHGNIAVGGNFAQHFHDHPPSRRNARAKPPVDVVSEEQAVRIKSLLDELIEVDRRTSGTNQSEQAVRSKWWGALYKHVPATSYKNFSQKKFNKALKWAQKHKARMLASEKDGDSGEWRKNAYKRIKGYMREHGLEKRQYYSELSARVKIAPPFDSLTTLSDDELGRVYAAVGRDSRKM